MCPFCWRRSCGGDVPLALPLVPVFMLLIRERFIRAEEQRLRDGFGAAFDDWAARVRRWI